MNGRRFLMVCAVVGLILGATMVTAQAQAMKIGVFDAQKIFEETAAGAQVQARLNALEENMRGKIEAGGKELQALQQQLLTTGASLSAEKLRELRLNIDRKNIELEGMQKSASREFQMEVERAQQEWQGKILTLVARFGKESGYSLIIPVSVVAFHSAATDITSELIKLVDVSGGAPAGS